MGRRIKPCLVIRLAKHCSQGNSHRTFTVSACYVYKFECFLRVPQLFKEEKHSGQAKLDSEELQTL